MTAAFIDRLFHVGDTAVTDNLERGVDQAIEQFDTAVLARASDFITLGQEFGSLRA